jgi:SpoVK/Ycf46/Vps4 family AAA+-type ATPase
MTKLINALDKKSKNYTIYPNQNLSNNSNSNSNSNRKRKNIINDLLRNYNRDFYNQNSEPLLKNIIFNLSFKKYKLYIEKENVTINKEINNFEDIIELLNNYPLVENANFNINLDKLHQIKNEIIELNNIIGNSDIKNNILNQILFYLQNFHINTGINYMHTVINGPPGTGKTEIAKLIGKIFCKLGILKNGTFKKVVRADLIAGYLGQTALKTKKVIEEACGGVLFIDEAYALGNPEKRDSFSKECIDTLCEGLSDNRDKLMVIIAGYEDELENCFFNYNPGLKSRFPWVFKTDKSTPSELKKIFFQKVKNINWKIDEIENIEEAFFEKYINYFKNYGRDMEVLLMKVTICHSKRVFCLDKKFKTIISKEDLDNGFNSFKKDIKTDNENDLKNIFSMYN